MKRIRRKPLTERELLRKIYIYLKRQGHAPRFITAEEASKYLGIQLSYLYKLTHQNQITFYKPSGKLLYFRKVDLDKYIAKKKVPSIYEIKEMINSKDKE